MDRVADEAQIQRVINLYSQLLDDGRFGEWGELFTDDAVFTVWDLRLSGRTAIVEAIGGMQPERPGKHVGFAAVIDVEGDRAWAWTDLVALADAGEGPFGRAYTVATAARYYDEFARGAGGRWRFSARRMRMAGDPLPDGARPSPAS